MVIAAALQLPGWGGDIQERERVAAARVAEAVTRGACVVVLPEAYLPGYHHSSADAGGAARRFSLAQASTHGVTMITGFLCQEAGKTWCCLGAATPAGGWSVYRKRYPSPAESRVWSDGRASVVVTTPAGRVGLLICADVLQAAAWREFAEGVDLVVVAAAWPDYRGRQPPPVIARTLGWVYRESGPHRDALLGRAARALGVPIVFANACGRYQGEESFSGGSGIWGADGSCLVRAGEGVEVVLAAVAAAPLPMVEGGVPRVAPSRWRLHRDLRWIGFTEAWRLAVRRGR